MNSHRPLSILRVLPALLALLAAGMHPLAAADKPNLVFILADDLGYGDLQCLNPAGRIPTPHLDRLAAEGMAFTDAHSSSSVCTPTRYGILTGRYNWRSRLQNGVLSGYSPRLIEPGRVTVASFLKTHGYATACLGKWHLGMGWPLKTGGFAENEKQAWDVDYSRPVTDGPNSLGFDYFFGISASLDMPPYVYIENDRVLGTPTTEKKWIRQGPATEDFEAIDVLPRITEKAVGYIRKNAGQPFFLYLPLSAPHTPILPASEWKDKSGLNHYADFVMQVDATAGKIMDALETAGISKNTLLIFTSDNGCSPQAGFKELADKGHHPSYRFRGHKADIFDGGHRIPFLVRWPDRISPGTRSDRLVCLNDLMASCADILKVDLPDNTGEDSISFLPALASQPAGPRRENLIHHSINGAFAIRKDNWKLILGPDSGGWSEPKPGQDKTNALPPVQLYDLASDVGEKINLSEKHPEIVVRLTRILEDQVARGRSTPGDPQENTGRINIWKGGRKR